MNSRKLSLALATVATILGGSVLPSHAAPSPSKGVVCRASFTGESVDGGFRCQRKIPILIGNVCDEPQFPKLNLRAKASSNPAPNDLNTNGRDVCSSANATIPATGPLTGLNQGRDFTPSRADRNARAKAAERLERGFISGLVTLPALGKKRKPEIVPQIPPNEREAVVVSEVTLIDDDEDIDDHTRVTFNVFILPIQRQ